MSEPRLQGWECPGCNLVYAPGVLACWRCGCSHPAVWQPASEPASEQRAIHDLRQGIAGFVPHPNSRSMDEALDVLVAALAAARGDTP